MELEYIHLTVFWLKAQYSKTMFVSGLQRDIVYKYWHEARE